MQAEDLGLQDKTLLDFQPSLIPSISSKDFAAFCQLVGSDQFFEDHTNTGFRASRDLSRTDYQQSRESQQQEEERDPIILAGRDRVDGGGIGSQLPTAEEAESAAATSRLPANPAPHHGDQEVDDDSSIMISLEDLQVGLGMAEHVAHASVQDNTGADEGHNDSSFANPWYILRLIRLPSLVTS